MRRIDHARSVRDDARGQSLVEMALILLPFLMITIGLFDAGRAIYAYNTVSNAARVAARTAIVDQDPATVRNAAIEEAAGLGLDNSNVVLGQCTTFDCTYTVTVNWDFEPITPIIGQVFNPTISSTAEMQVENPNP